MDKSKQNETKEVLYAQKAPFLPTIQIEEIFHGSLQAL